MQGDTEDERIFSENIPARTPSSWPAVMYEELPWERGEESLLLIPKSRRRKILPTYRAAVPPAIARLDPRVSGGLSDRIDEALVSLTRFDAECAARGFNLPALLLRSESAASSQIENLTSSARNIALAQLTGKAPRNAMMIAGNIDAMRTALALPDDLSVEGICAIHRALMVNDGHAAPGCLRREQVWVGGTPYSPHGAMFVPPGFGRVGACLDDLVLFANRHGVNPVVRAALVHAQFETIHPFLDGNGRTGRTLVHKLLRRDGVLSQSSVPLSAGLLHSIDAYMGALALYQQGEIDAVVEQVVDALELAVALGNEVAHRMDEIFAEWAEAVHARAGSSILKLPSLLAEQPVVNSAFVAGRLDITLRAANNLIDRACEAGILRRIGTQQRGVSYQADALIEVLEAASSATGVRRMLTRP